MLYRSGAKKTKIQQITEAKQKRRTPRNQPTESDPQLLPEETVKAFIDVITDEFRDMVAKLLQPIKDGVGNIPGPVAGSAARLEKIPEAA